MSVTAQRTYYPKDDPKAITLLEKGRDALMRRDFSAAMRFFKKTGKHRISKKLAALLLNQMANCMDQLEYYDQQQTFLEELVELELNLPNLRQLIKIYNATNNEVKRNALVDKIKQIKAVDDKEEKELIGFLAQCKSHDDVLEWSLKRFETHPEDLDSAKTALNTYVTQTKIKEAEEFAEKLIEAGHEDKLCMELSNLRKELFDYEGCRDYLLKHLEIHKENIYGVNKVAHTLMTNVCYHGTLDGDDYVMWAERAALGTKPQIINSDFSRNTNLFRRIRVGLVSYDFRRHSVGKFIMSLFDEILNNTGIETYCYYTYPDHEDEYTHMIKDRADVFKSVGRYSDKQLRKELLEDRLDILVDLNGQTAGTKLHLLAERFAPIQVTWMGFPFSSFYYNIDYIIGDYFFDTMDGETERYCTEKVLRMDPCYMCFALMSDLYVEPEPPQVYNGYVTFGMMNNPNKYSEESIRLWQKCLEATPDSRLLIQLSKFGEGFEQEKLKERLEKFGLDLSRVDFGTDYGQQGYYRTYNKCDVMLDSLPFGGGTTTPEAIWMGVPVIGCQYHMRHGRMAYSFMTNVGLGDLCAESVEAYPEKAREVATNVELLRDLRQNLRASLKDMPLFRTDIFRTAFENAMRDAYLKHSIENKKPFDTSVYEGDDGLLLRDCVRAADILTYEITREFGADDEVLEALMREYYTLHGFLLERLSVVYEEDAAALSLAVQTAELVEAFGAATDLEAMLLIVKSIRTMLLKFA